MAEVREADVSSRVGAGVAWSAMNSFLLRASQFAMGIVIARVVSPHDFGVFVVALTVFTIVINISEVGVSAAIVRDPNRTAELAPTVTTIALATSAVLTVLMAVTAPWTARALGSSAATSSVQVMSLTVLLAGVSAVPVAILTRDYRQKQRFYADLSFFLSSNGLLLLLALTGFGALALAWSRVAGQLVSTLFFLHLAKERYRIGFDRKVFRELLRFGVPLTGANLLGFGIANLDFMVVGRMRGALQLGYYNLAFNISNWPVSVFSTVLNGITLPTLSRARGSSRELRVHLSAGLSALAAAAIPVSALSIALAQPIVVTVYGQRWKPAAAVLVVISIFGATRVVVTFLTDLLVALGVTRSLLSLQAVWMCVLVPTMIFSVHRWGIVGAGVANALVAGLVVIPSYLVRIHRQGLGLDWFVGSLFIPLLGGVDAALAARLTADHVRTPLFAVLLGTAAGVLAYVAVTGVWLYRFARRVRALYGKGRGAHAPAAVETIEEPDLTELRGAATLVAAGGPR